MTFNHILTAGGSQPQQLRIAFVAPDIRDPSSQFKIATQREHSLTKQQTVAQRNNNETMALSMFFNERPLFGFDDFFSSDPVQDFNLMPVIPNMDRGDDLVLRATSPGYEIHQVNGNFQICVDVPGVKAADLTVNVEHEGKVLHIAGGRKVVKDNGDTSEVKFEKRFTIGRNMNIDKMTANLADGVLTLTAPVKEEEKKKVHTIAITEGKHEQIEEKKES
jgi:HSP20 family protein